MSELDTTALPSVTQAMAIIDAVEVFPKIEQLPVHEARGRRLARDITADRDYPPFRKSLMDGYAVICADVLQVPIDLQYAGEVAAGGSGDLPIARGQTVAIMTGAPLPSDADGIVPVEETEKISDGSQVRILRATTPGRYIAARGSDCPAGAVVLKRGVMLESAQLAVAASVGAATVTVFARPRVAVLSTGDELVPIDQIPGPSQIRNSNNIMLVSLLQRLGCDVTDLGTAIDQPQTIRAAIETGLKFDVLFVTGGMSMGVYDFVPHILKDLQIDLRITKVRIKPGKPFVFGINRNPPTPGAEQGDAPDSSSNDHPSNPTFVFGLPGNPVSGYVCTLRLASRLLTRLGGGAVAERWVTGRLDAGLPANGPREFYQPAMWLPASGGKSSQNEFAAVTPLQWKGSADIYTLASANALLVRAENEPPIPKGTLVRVLEM